ncbi:MAG: T6SS effector amidase Tae4 family protein [Bacteroidales bacterium]
MNRLTNWKVTRSGVVTKFSMEYDKESGSNIWKKSDLGATAEMSYGGKRPDRGEDTYGPHAVTKIINVVTTPPLADLDVTYTDFKKIASLSEGDKYYTLDYGVDDQRRMSVYTVGGSLKQTRYYVGDYEEETDATTGNVRKIHYLSGGAMLVDNNGVETLYYAYSDFQGSLIALTDAAGAVVEKYAYDPWGARRNPADWSQKDNRTSWLTNRGYTGHEHLDAFGIINMNGRVYDPLTAMFMSPDPYVQAPDNWLNYNRYGYCYGNPFKYTDPSGEFFFSALIPGLGTIIDAACWGALIGGAGYTLSCVVNQQVWDSRSFWGAVGMGAISGVVTMGIGKAFGATGSIYKEVGRALVHGYAQGVMSFASGGDFMQGFLSGSLGSLGGSAFQSIAGEAAASSLWGTVGFSALSGGVGAELSGGDFLKGAATGAIVGLLNHGHNAHQKKMAQHFIDKQLKKIFDAYPKPESFIGEGYSKDELYELIGGPLEDWNNASPDQLTNTCAIRLSYAFNKAGYMIPQIDGATFKGANDLNYFLRVEDIAGYLTNAFGDPTTLKSNQTIKNAIIWQSDCGWSDATGHMDIIYRGQAGSQYHQECGTVKYWH